MILPVAVAAARERRQRDRAGDGDRHRSSHLEIIVAEVGARPAEDAELLIEHVGSVAGRCAIDMDDDGFRIPIGGRNRLLSVISRLVGERDHGDGIAARGAITVNRPLGTVQDVRRIRCSDLSRDAVDAGDETAVLTLYDREVVRRHGHAEDLSGCQHGTRPQRARTPSRPLRRTY